MFDIQKTIDSYENGILTSTETVFRLVCGASDADIVELMKLIPSELLPFLKDYVEKYEPGKMVSVGGAPEVPHESIVKLKNWFDVNE